MFKNYRIKCPEQSEYDKTDSSVNYVRQQYCDDVQKEKSLKKYPTEVSLSIYPEMIRVPKYCSSKTSDNRRSSELCRKIKKRAESLKRDKIDGDFGSTISSTERERKGQGVPTRLYNPLP
jgi:hypothetical protein